MSFLQRFFRRIAAGPEPVERAPDVFAVLNQAWIGQGIYVAVVAGLFDHLHQGSKSARVLALITGFDASRLEQLLRALAVSGLLVREDTDRYGLTAVTQSLVRDRQNWMRQYVLLWGEQLYPAGDRMIEMMKTGGTAFAHAHGRPVYEHYRVDPNAGRRFTEYMDAVTDWQSSVIAAEINFSHHQHVFDVAGGRASLVIAILKNNPHLRGSILDQPHMEEEVRGRIDHAGLGDRCTFIGGNMLKSVPQGADLYLIKHVLHDWGDEDVRLILQNCAAAMTTESTLIVIEGVLNESSSSDRMLVMRDLEQMIWTGGRVRAREEFESLFSDAGLHLSGIRRTPIVDASLIAARR
jgi:hypothetical protein